MALANAPTASAAPDGRAWAVGYAARMAGDDLADLEYGATEAHPRQQATSAGGFVVTVIDGPDAGSQLAVDGSAPSPLLVGQSPVCALRLRDPRVSRRHLALELVGGRLRVTDLASTNGTYCSALAIRDAYLCGGEALQLGQTHLGVERRSGPAAPPPSARTGFGRVLGESLAMRRLYPLVERMAAADIPLVIEGETGTGKEALAEAIHELSPRASRPFVVFDCTATPAQLMESDLFGHERGAFTGALSPRKGVFELAHGGTLLIDEIGELDVALQPKFLRAIERSEIRRVGSEAVIRVDVRIIAATRRDLDKEVQDQRFRDDLFYRLAVGRIELPALRQRHGDIALLARHFWTQLGGDSGALSADAIRRWEAEDWPGNVRQLRNAVARALALGDLEPAAQLGGHGEHGEHAGGAPAPARRPAGPAPDGFLDAVIAERLPLPVARLRVVKEFEQRYIAALLAEHGTVAKAAAASGIARRYFQLLRGGKRRES
jgi:transcriptional regulator with GAF, ATPase, and Fis domain